MSGSFCAGSAERVLLGEPGCLGACLKLHPFPDLSEAWLRLPGARRIFLFDSAVPRVFLWHLAQGSFTGEELGSLSFAAKRLDCQWAQLSLPVLGTLEMCACVCVCVHICAHIHVCRAHVCMCTCECMPGRVHTCAFEGTCSQS